MEFIPSLKKSPCVDTLIRLAARNIVFWSLFHWCYCRDGKDGGAEWRSTVALWVLVGGQPSSVLDMNSWPMILNYWLLFLLCRFSHVYRAESKFRFSVSSKNFEHLSNSGVVESAQSAAHVMSLMTFLIHSQQQLVVKLVPPVHERDHRLQIYKIYWKENLKLARLSLTVKKA